MTPTHCTAPGCTKPHRARGLCAPHYNQQVRAGILQTGERRPPNAGKVCSFDGCDCPSKGLGLCRGHYNQQWRGMPLTPLVGPRRRPQKGCSFPGCDNRHNSHGYCSHHARQYREGKPLTPILPRSERPTLPRNPDRGCTVDGCDGKHRGRGLCRKHLSAVYRREKGIAEAKPREAKAATPKPAKSTLPPTWERVQPVKRHPKPAGGDAEIGPVKPTDPAILRMMADKLRHWGDVDLIDMLGVTPDRIADAEAEWGRVA